MKNSKSIKIASILLVLVLVTSCFVGGTFAKYVTQDGAEDSARVAKFGVEVLADGSLFENSYINAPATGDAITVDATDNVVAPGTNNAEEAFTFSITGTPEVDVKVTVDVTNDEDIYLGAGTYENVTTGDPDDTTVVSADYYPVKYTLKNKGVAVENVEDVTLAELKTALVDLSATHNSGTDLEAKYGEYEISWKWDFGTEGEPNGNDPYDTILGDLMAEEPTALIDGESGAYNLKTGLKLDIRVEQVD